MLQYVRDESSFLVRIECLHNECVDVNITLSAAVFTVIGTISRNPLRRRDVRIKTMDQFGSRSPQGHFNGNTILSFTVNKQYYLNIVSLIRQLYTM